MLKLSHLTQAIAAVVVVAAISGCGILGGTMEDKPTINQSQAERRIDELIGQATAGLDPKPRLVRNENWDLLRKCPDPSDGGSPNRIIVVKSYWLEGIPTSMSSSIAQQIKDNLEAKGHVVTRSSGMTTDQPNFLASSRPDDFRMSMTARDDGSLSFGASSPCVWQGGTPGGEPSLG